MRLKYLNFLFVLEIYFCRAAIFKPCCLRHNILCYAAAVIFFFIQKADGLCHPLLKLSLLNFVKLRLESEVQFGEDGFSIFAVFFAFKVIVVNYCNDVFSKSKACANIPAFVTLIKYISVLN